MFIQMKVLVTGSSSLPGKENSISSFASLAQGLGRVVADLGVLPDVFICVDYHPRFRDEIRMERKQGIPTVLVKQEPNVSAPVHKLPNPDNVFDLVVKRGDPYGSPIFITFQECNIRYLSQQIRKDRVVTINADKWSAIAGDFYSFRRICFSSDDRIELFGHGSSEKNSKRLQRLFKEVLIAIGFMLISILAKSKTIFLRPLNYLGQGDDNMSTLAEYKVLMGIENSREYMSEKLVDALLAGNVPVYVGADPKRFGLPEELYFSCEPDLGEVREIISQGLSVNSEDFRSKVKVWIESDEFKSFWEVRSVTKTLSGGYVGVGDAYDVAVLTSLGAHPDILESEAATLTAPFSQAVTLRARSRSILAVANLIPRPIMRFMFKKLMATRLGKLMFPVLDFDWDRK